MSKSNKEGELVLSEKKANKFLKKKGGSSVFRRAQHRRNVSESTFSSARPRRKSLGDQEDADSTTLPTALISNAVRATLVSESDADTVSDSDFVESFSELFETLNDFLEDCLFLLSMLGDVPDYISANTAVYKLDMYVEFIKNIESTFIMRDFKPLLSVVDEHRSKHDQISHINNSKSLGLLTQLIKEGAELRLPESVKISSPFGKTTPLDFNLHQTFNAGIIPIDGGSKSYQSNRLITVRDHVSCTDVEFLSGINAYRAPGLSEDIFRDAYERFRNSFLKQIEQMNPLLKDNVDTRYQCFEDLESYTCYFLIKTMPLVLRLYSRAIDISDIVIELVKSLSQALVFHNDTKERDAINSGKHKQNVADLFSKINGFFELHRNKYQYLLTSCRVNRAQPAMDGLVDQQLKKYELLQLALVMGTKRIETTEWPKDISLVLSRSVSPDIVANEAEKLKQLSEIHNSLNGLSSLFNEANRVFDRLTSALRETITFEVCVSEIVPYDIEVQLQVGCGGTAADIRIVDAYGETELKRENENYYVIIPKNQKSVELLVRVSAELLASYGGKPIMLQLMGLKKINAAKKGLGKSLRIDNDCNVLCLTLLNVNSVSVVEGSTNQSGKSSKLLVSLQGMGVVLKSDLNDYLDQQRANLHCRFFSMRNVSGNNYGKKSLSVGNRSGSIDNSALSPRRRPGSKPSTPRDEDGSDSRNLRGQVFTRKSGGMLSKSMHHHASLQLRPRSGSGSLSDGTPILPRKSGNFGALSPNGSPRVETDGESRRAFKHPEPSKASTPVASPKVSRAAGPPPLRKMKSAIKFNRPEQPRDGSDPSDDRKDVAYEFG